MGARDRGYYRIQSCLFEPKYAAEEILQGEAVATLAVQKDMVGGDQHNLNY